RVAEVRITQTVLQEDHQRELGEVVAGEHVDGTALDHLARRAQAVAVEPAAIRDAEDLGHTSVCLTRRRAERSTDPVRLSLLRERGHALRSLRGGEQVRALLLRGGEGLLHREARHRSHEALRLGDRDGAALRDRVALLLYGGGEAVSGHDPVQEAVSKRAA